MDAWLIRVPRVVYARDAFAQVVGYMAAHGYLPEAARALAATPDLRDDEFVLSRVLAQVDRSGATLLTVAVKRGDTARARRLLEVCATPAARAALLEQRDHAGRTPLMWAREPATAAVLLAAGANVRAVAGDLQHDAVRWVAADGTPAVLAALLAAFDSDAARRAAVNRADAAGVTPLMVVNDPASATLLLNAGAVVGALDDEERSAHVHAVVDARPRVLEVLLRVPEPFAARHARVNFIFPGTGGQTLLMTAHDGDSARLLLAAGANFLAVDEDGDDALAHAAANGWPHTVAALLAALGLAARSARVNLARPPLLRTLLMSVADGASAQHLIDAGANVRAVDRDGCSAFVHAVAGGRPRVLEVLLRALGSPFERRQVATSSHPASGLKLLMRAVDADCVRQLVAAGAYARDYTVTDAKKLDAFDHIVARTDDSACGVLAALLASLHPQERVVVICRAQHEGRTLLMRAARADTARMLLAAGAVVEAFDADDNGAIAHAVVNSREGVLRVLLEALPSAAARRVALHHFDLHGMPPLLRARTAPVVQALLAAGADVFTADGGGRDAFWHAAGRPAVLHALLQGLSSDEERERVKLRPDLVGAVWL